MCSSPISTRPEPLNVVFVHGWACGWQDWSGVTSRLSDDVQIGVVKLPGSPNAVPLKGAISRSECAAYVIAHVDELGFERFAVVGHSMGTRIAIELAANWRDRVSHLLLLDGSNVPEDPNEAVARLAGQLTHLGQNTWAEAAFETMMLDNLDPEQTCDLVSRAADYSTHVLLAYYYAMAAWDRDHFGAAIEQLTCPVTIMQSTSLDENETRHPVTSHPSSRWLDALRARLPQAVITLVSNTGHFVMLEQPQLVADWVKNTAHVYQDDHPKELKQLHNQH
jgi:pimeloyl-ACP methyl ester carboxylesterase